MKRMAEVERLAQENAVCDADDALEKLERVQQETVEALRAEIARLEAYAAAKDLAHAGELARWRSSAEWVIGNTVWNRAGIRRIGRPAVHILRLLRDRRNRAQLLARNTLGRTRRRKPPVIVAACWSFPISSQTFVYQEIQSLEWAELDPVVFCCETNAKTELPSAYAALWDKKLVLVAEWDRNQLDLQHFRKTRPERVEGLLSLLESATGRTTEALLQESVVMMGFTFARHVELSGAPYIHTYFFYDQSFMALMAAHLLDLPRGITAYADHMLNDYAFKCVPLHLQLADIVVATSRRIRDELSALSGGRFDAKIIVKPNGIDTSRFPHVAPAARFRSAAEPELISVSRIEPKKGLIHLVDAVKILEDRGKRVRLNIVGGVDAHTPTSATYFDELCARIDDLRLGDCVVLHGRKQQAELVPLLARSHVFVAPYVEVASGDKDGVPTALLEGMSTGLPVVATDAGSITEVITDGVEGIVVDQRVPDQIADAVERLLDDPALYTVMADAARTRAVSEFDARVTEVALHDRIREALAARRR